MSWLVARVLQAFQDFESRKIDCGFLTLQGCLNDMLEVSGRNDYKIRHMGKQVLLRQFGYQPPRTFAATEEALQVVQMFSGDGGEISDIGDNDSGAGAGDGAIGQMIMPIVTV